MFLKKEMPFLSKLFVGKVELWTLKLHRDVRAAKDIFNVDKTGLFFKCTPDKTVVCMSSIQTVVIVCAIIQPCLPCSTPVSYTHLLYIIFSSSYCLSGTLSSYKADTISL